MRRIIIFLNFFMLQIALLYSETFWTFSSQKVEITDNGVYVIKATSSQGQDSFLSVQDFQNIDGWVKSRNALKADYKWNDEKRRAEGFDAPFIVKGGHFFVMLDSTINLETANEDLNVSIVEQKYGNDFKVVSYYDETGTLHTITRDVDGKITAIDNIAVVNGKAVILSADGNTRTTYVVSATEDLNVSIVEQKYGNDFKVVSYYDETGTLHTITRDADGKITAIDNIAVVNGKAVILSADGNTRTTYVVSATEDLNVSIVEQKYGNDFKVVSYYDETGTLHTITRDADGKITAIDNIAVVNGKAVILSADGNTR